MAEVIMAAQSMSEVTETSTQPMAHLKQTDFDITRAFTLLMVTLVLPLHLALSVLTYSMAALY